MVASDLIIGRWNLQDRVKERSDHKNQDQGESRVFNSIVSPDGFCLGAHDASRPHSTVEGTKEGLLKENFGGTHCIQVVRGQDRMGDGVDGARKRK